MPSGTRLQRIADRIRQELSEMLIREISDPRLKQIYVTDVKVDKELAYADIFVSAIEGVSRSADVLAGLESASGFIRKNLASRVELQAVGLELDLFRRLPRRGLSHQMAAVRETTDGLRRELHTVIAESHSPAYVDLSGVTFFDSSSIAVLVDAHRLAPAHGSELVVVSPSQECQRVFDILGLGDVLDIRDGMPNA